MDNDQKSTKLSYWRWMVESWRHPMGMEANASHGFGIWTLIWEDIILFWGFEVAGASIIDAVFPGAIAQQLSTEVNKFLFTLMILIFCFQIVTVLCSMVGHLFVFGSGSIGNFWGYVNKVMQASNWNIWISIVGFICLLFTSNLGFVTVGYYLTLLFCVFFGLAAFVNVLRGEPENKPVKHDTFYGALIYVVLLGFAYAILIALFRVVLSF